MEADTSESAKSLTPADDIVKDIPKNVSSALWSFLAMFLWATWPS